MTLKPNASDFKAVLAQHGITKLYHFTDRENLKSIIENGGLHSWADCADKGIHIPRPGGDQTSHDLDQRDCLHHHVRVSFTREHPMMYVAMNDGRIANPVILEIDPEVICWEGTQYANTNAVKNGANVGPNLSDFKKIHFSSVKAKKHFDLDDDERPYFQAEVLVKNCIPLQYITNIGNFGIPLYSYTPAPSYNMIKHAVASPAAPVTVFETKDAYTANITRSTPTAFIFLVDHSVSMNREIDFRGERMRMADAVSIIINGQINELVSRCIKGNEIRHYYDFAVIGYGQEAYYGWKGNLEGREFVSPEELYNNPYIKRKVREEKRTRKGVVVKEVEKVQWLEPRCDGSWTHLDKALEKAQDLLNQWMEKYHDKDCYPPTIINITDGEFNGRPFDYVLQLADELKSLHTNDGNVLLFNIHITSGQSDALVFPIRKSELRGNRYGEQLFALSSLLPLRYNDPISQMRNDPTTDRHIAMAVDADMTKLIQLLDIGTPTNINQNR